jgi:hypothetical protein
MVASCKSDGKEYLSSIEGEKKSVIYCPFRAL